MKYIYKKSILLVFIASMMISCDSNLEQLPSDSFATENAFITASDFENGIRGVYVALLGGSYYGGNFLAVPDVLSDNVITTQRGRSTLINLHEWTYNAASGYRGLYQDAYTVIFNANQVLEFIDGFEGESKDNIKGEALALRAFAHFDLVRTFAKIPTQSSDANGSLGIVYKSNSTPSDLLPRESVADVYQHIIVDLEEAYSLINATNPEARLNKEGVAILLSRAYLYMGRWQDAINAANNVSTNIASRDDVVGVWEDSSQEGLVFWVPNETGVIDSNIGVQWSQGSVANLIPEYAATFEFNALYGGNDGNDIRRAAYIVDATDDSGLAYNGVKKLLGRGTQTNGIVDIKILRAAEAVLNKAEAQFMLGSEGPARQTLNSLRSERYINAPDNESGTALRDAIRNERRLEFGFEYQRIFDIKRWGLSVNRGNEGDLADGSGTPSIILNLAADNFRMQLPIDQSSLIVNPSLQQNPGY
jgi:hypothetical protein